MRFALLVGFVVAVLGQRSPPVCFPPSCEIDAHCQDTIHNRYGRCCGGVCSLNSLPSDKLIGESCTPSGMGESCAGSCNPDLYCSDVDDRCHARHGLGCNCTTSSECLSGYCRPPTTIGAQRTCGGFNLDVNETCVAANECKTGICFNGKCSTLTLGVSCYLFGTACDAPYVCRANASGNDVCSALCDLNVAGCCTSSTDCAPHPGGVECNSGGACQIPPGNGEMCTDQTGCRNDTGPLFCDTLCNDTATPPYICSLNKFCQPYYTLSLGAICSTSNQCSGGATCLLNASNNQVCTPPIPLGGSCGSYSAYGRCAAPGNMCQYNGSSTYVCKANGTTPVNGSCYTDQTGRGMNECVPGYTCASDGNSVTGYSCAPLLALGAQCTYGVSPSLQCAPPANLCTYTYGIYAPYICKQSNSTPVGSQCSPYSNLNECISPATCSSGTYLCTGSLVGTIALGAPCSSEYNYPNCASPGNMCLINGSGTYVCKQNGTTPVNSPCTVDGTGRSLDECVYPSKCRTNGTTNVCLLPVALGGVCYSSGYASSAQYNYALCASPGNMCSWNGTHGICKQNGTTPVGAACYPDSVFYPAHSECVVNSTCTYNSLASPTYYTCVPPPTPITLGQPCGTLYDYGKCAFPGNMCVPASSTSPTPVCKKSGTTPLGSACTPDTASSHDECVNGTSCATNGGTYSCQAWITGGTPCSTVSSSPKCDIGCVADPTCNTPCYISSACCKCLSKNLQQGDKCFDSRQCIGQYSYCDIASTYTCKSLIGKQCQYYSDCLYGGLDCDCHTQKCYLLNAPTPVPPTRSPTAPTATRAPTPARCDPQLAAWYSVTPANFTFVNFTGPYVDYSNFVSSFVPQALTLDTSTQAKLIDLVCCFTCPQNSRFNSRVYRGYQVDCAAKTLTQLPDTCNDFRASLAFLNCWSPIVSSASSLGISVGAVLAVIAAAALFD